jgi:hypothetical protein
MDPVRRGLDQASGGGSSEVLRSRYSGLNPYVRVGAPIFFGLFFVEYLPLFAVGYWSWGYWIHKVLSGIFIILNLAIAEYAVRRSRARSRKPADGVTQDIEKQANAPN